MEFYDLTYNGKREAHGSGYGTWGKYYKHMLKIPNVSQRTAKVGN